MSAYEYARDARSVSPMTLSPTLVSLVIPVGGAVSSYWTPTNDVEIDIVGADRAPIARELLFVGSIKWLEQSPFDDHDLADQREGAR
jgi:hypothetical protein